MTRCDIPTGDRRESLGLLLRNPACIDAAIVRLKSVTTVDHDGRVWNDIAAAYYVRAQEHDAPGDLLSAFDAVARASAKSSFAEAAFNRALIEEALGFRDYAIESWSHVAAIGESGWSEEAARRRDQLSRDRALAAALSVDVTRRLPTIVQVRDDAALSRMIEQHPVIVTRFVEEQVLLAWARATNPTDANQDLQTATIIARAVARTKGDRYLLDSVERITDAERSGDPATLFHLRSGHALFAEASQESRSTLFMTPSIRKFKLAEAAFAVSGSPFRYRVAAASAVNPFDSNPETYLALAADYARTHRYEYLWKQIEMMRAYGLLARGRSVEALQRYSEPASMETRMDDDVAVVKARRIALLRELGLYELAWRTALEAIRANPIATRNFSLLEEVAASALALGHADAALRYQESVISIIEQNLSAEASQARIDFLRLRLASALRARAEMELAKGDSQRALGDLEQALRLSGESNAGVLLARIHEIRGKLAFGKNPQGAIAEFTRALELLPPRYDSGSVLVQRAGAHHRLGQTSAEIEDLRRALHEFLIDSHGSRGFGEPRTSEVDQASSRIVSLLALRGDFDAAFEFTEEAKHRRVLSLAKTAAWGTSPSLTLQRLRARLPADVLLLEYATLDDRTLVWIVSGDQTELLTLPASRSAIENRIQQIRAATASRDERSLDESLTALHTALLDQPLERIAKFAQSSTIVIIPDGPMIDVPFSALRSQRTRRYVVEDWTVSTAASATQYMACVERSRKMRRPPLAPVLLMADSAFDDRSILTRGLGRLPSAEIEVRRISSLYTNPVSRVSDAATGSAFFQLAPKAAVIHLAVHSIVNTRVSSQSLLLMTPSAGDTGLITYGEMVDRIQLTNANVVVLSACSTAGSQQSDTGGGTVALTSFLAAGASAVIGSLWEADDSITIDFMFRFHRHYAEGMDAAAALRSAQLEQLRGAALRSPLWWATWQIYGAGSSHLPRREIR